MRVLLNMPANKSLNDAITKGPNFIDDLFIATRGANITELSNLSLWREGPDFLKGAPFVEQPEYLLPPGGKTRNEGKTKQ